MYARLYKSSLLLIKALVYGLAAIGIGLGILLSANAHLRFMTLETAAHYVCKLTSAEVVVVGDSIGAGGRHWSGKLGLPLLKTRNLAGDGYTFDQLTGQISKALAYKPKAILIFAGTNDAFAMNRGRLAPDEFATDVQRVIEACGETTCFVVLPPPTNSREVNDTLGKIREIVISVASRNGAVCVDPADALSNGSGLIQAQYSTDGIHLTPQGYEVVCSRLKGAIFAEGAAPRE